MADDSRKDLQNADFPRPPFGMGNQSPLPLPDSEADRPRLRLTQSDLAVFSPFLLTAAIVLTGIIFSASQSHRPSAPWATTVITLLLFSHLPLAALLMAREQPGVRVFVLLVSALAAGASLIAFCMSWGSILGQSS